VFAAANRWVRGGPVVDGFLVITELIQDSCMLDKNHLEGWVVAWDLIIKHLEIPLP